MSAELVQIQTELAEVKSMLAELIQRLPEAGPGDQLPASEAWPDIPPADHCADPLNIPPAVMADALARGDRSLLKARQKAWREKHKKRKSGIYRNC